MPALLTAASTLQCPHGGTVHATPRSTRTRVDAALLRRSDSFSITNCPFPPSGTPHPCVTVLWQSAAVRVSAGDNVLTATSLGMCLAADGTPQGFVVVCGTQTRARGW